MLYNLVAFYNLLIILSVVFILFSISIHSFSGIESHVIPPPAYKHMCFLSNWMQRRFTNMFIENPSTIGPIYPQYNLRSCFSVKFMKLYDSENGNPHNAGVGCNVSNKDLIPENSRHLQVYCLHRWSMWPAFFVKTGVHSNFIFDSFNIFSI